MKSDRALEILFFVIGVAIRYFADGGNVSISMKHGAEEKRTEFKNAHIVAWVDGPGSVLKIRIISNEDDKKTIEEHVFHGEYFVNWELQA